MITQYRNLRNAELLALIPEDLEELKQELTYRLANVHTLVPMPVPLPVQEPRAIYRELD